MPSWNRCFETCNRCSLPTSSRKPNPKYCQNQEEIFIQLHIQIFVCHCRFSLLQALLLFVKFVGSFDSNSHQSTKSGPHHQRLLPRDVTDASIFQAFWPHFFEQEKPYNQLRLVVEIPCFSTSKRWVSLRISEPSAVGPLYQDGPKIPVISVGAHVPPLISGWKKNYANANLFIFGQS